MTTNYNMIIDTSGSMGMRISQEEEMKDYCMLDLGKILMMSFVKSLQKNDSISLISFSSSIKKICSNIKIDYLVYLYISLFTHLFYALCHTSSRYSY